MSGMTSERLRAITYDMNTRPNVTIADRYHAGELLAEVKRLREGIEDARMYCSRSTFCVTIPPTEGGAS